MDKGNSWVAASNSIINYWANTLFALSLGLISVVCYAQQDSSSPSECSASPEYLSKLERFFGSNKPAQDYSCLTNYPAIAKNIKSYQLVDIRNNPDTPVSNAWNIPVDELKLKDFLANRSLLLLGESFSRVQQATACATLKKAGFASVKILVGGIAQWDQINTKKPKPKRQPVSAADFIYEYFNGHVSVVAATEAASSQLNALGFSEHRLLPANTFSNVADIVIGASNGGYDPVVYIGSPADSATLEFNQHLPNLYFLQGGIEALVAQLRRDQLIEYSRTKPQEASFCAKK